MAKIVRFYETGGPEVLRVEEADLGAPATGEVLIAVEAIGLNRAEAAMRAGHYILKATLPSRLGAECAGRVLMLGEGVTDLKVGDRVFTLSNVPQSTHGVYASEAVVPAACVVKAPAELNMGQAASTFVAFLTAWGGLIETAKLQRNSYVVVTAASSSVGLAAIQIAHDCGAIPIATTRRRDKADALIAAGAAHVIVTAEEDMPAEISKLSQGKGVSLIFDPVAGPFVDTLCQCLADDGMLMIYGGMANQPAVFPRQLAIRRNLTMRGYNFFPLLADKRRRDVAIASIVERLREKRFSMPIAREFSLGDVVEAHRYLESNQQVGKVVMRP